MKGNLAQREPERLKKWNEGTLYKKFAKPVREDLRLFFMTVLLMPMVKFILVMRLIKFSKTLFLNPKP